jgi:hypothetical protein
MIKDDYSQVKNMIEWLGLDWESNKQKVYDFVDEKLWKAKKK